MIPFSICLIEDDDEQKARDILGPDTATTVRGATLYAKAEAEQIEALLEKDLLVSIAEEIDGDVPLQRNDVEFNPLADIATDTPSVDMPGPGTFATVAISGPLTEERQQVMERNGIEIRSRLEGSRYVVRMDTDLFDGLGPAWMAPGQYGIAETTGDFAFEGTLGYAGEAILFDPDARDRSRSPRSDRILPRPLSNDRSFSQAGLPSFLDIGDLIGRVESPKPSIFEARCHRPHSPAALKAILERDPRVQSVDAGKSRVRVTVVDPQGNFLRDLARLEIVEHAEPFVPYTFELTYAVGVVAGGRPRPPGLIWKGAGETIGIADSGIDALHPDLAGRVTVKLITQPPSDRDPNGHGTHVASIAAGSGAASDGELAGMAPEAHIYVQSLLDENGNFDLGSDGVRTLLEDAYAADVRIQNFSFGAAVGGRYTLDALELDAFVHAHEDMLVVVACGNNGRQDDTDPAAPTRRTALHSLASPASAKNCLTVGASGTTRTDGPYAGRCWDRYDGYNSPKHPPMSGLAIVGDQDTVAPLSSRGPTREGRLKPDLVAPGVCIAAARSADSDPKLPIEEHDGRYCYLTGTSMAAPLVSGSAAVLRQYLRQERNHQPSAALLKACLINSAQWLKGEGWEDPDIGQPNFHQGFGLMSLARIIPAGDAAFALQFDDIRNADAAALTAGDNPRWSRSIDVSGDHPLAATLAWTDPGGRGLQSDLELVLIDPVGDRFIANGDLRRAPFEKRDNRNNVKRIVVEHPKAGPWRAVVVANDSLERQGFALAMTGRIAP